MFYDKNFLIELDKDKNKVQDLSTAVFNVSVDGIVTPLKGGIAYLRVAPEDSFTSANDPTRYVDILIKVLDGKSEETAYTISTVEELVQIGNNKSTMSLYYVLCDNIDISQKIKNQKLRVFEVNKVNGRMTAGYVNQDKPEYLNLNSILFNELKGYFENF